jgi:hypothetical protein
VLQNYAEFMFFKSRTLCAAMIRHVPWTALGPKLHISNQKPIAWHGPAVMFQLKLIIYGFQPDHGCTPKNVTSLMGHDWCVGMT